MTSLKTYLLIIIVVLASCNRSGLSKKLAGCDSLVITFNESNKDSIIHKINTTETKAIQKMAGFLKGKETEFYKCGYDGNMLFFKGGIQEESGFHPSQNHDYWGGSLSVQHFESNWLLSAWVLNFFFQLTWIFTASSFSMLMSTFYFLRVGLHQLLLLLLVAGLF